MERFRSKKMFPAFFFLLFWHTFVYSRFSINKNEFDSVEMDKFERNAKVSDLDFR
jgi:hypothetical protein